MAKKLFSFIITFIIALTIFTGSFFVSYAQEQSEDQTEEQSTDQSDSQAKGDLQKKIDEFEKKLSELRNQKDTLSSQIQYMDTQIYLTGLRVQETNAKIEKTEFEIGKLDDWIGDLDVSLDELSKTMIERITASYKNRKASVIDIVFDSKSASDIVNKLKYYEVARESNKKVLLEVQEAKSNYEEQKELREKKKEELDSLHKTLVVQEEDLTNQQEAKRDLLERTQSDEKTYQQLLERAKAEYAAIQQIVAGVGTETYIRNVTKGDTIASLISGPSCNSSGEHLHFIVKEGDNVVDPFTKLKQVDSVNDSNGDPFNPSGSWDWPLPPTIELHQGYGETWFVRAYGWYRFHNGIDITGTSSGVQAVADGKLYHGSYSGFNGCALPYVKVVHNDSNISTFYLHVNY